MATEAQKIVKRAGDYLRATTIVPIAVTAIANTDFAFTIPPGAVDVSYTLFTTTAFGAATDAMLQLGSTVGGVDYVAAATVKALGVYAMTRVAAAAAAHLSPGGLTVNGRIVQSGTASAVGAASLVVSYGLPVS